MRIYDRVRDVAADMFSLPRRADEIKFNQGLILSELQAHKASTDLRDHEFKVFSQWGEDGIIQYLVRNVDIRNRTFIEFGVEDFFEANCRFLMMKDCWSGFVIDGSRANMARLRRSDFYWKRQLVGRCAFVDRENIAAILEESGFDHDLGILSVDIDGVDYFVLESLAAWRPRILIVEYNGTFGFTRPVSVPYDASFHRTAGHWSNIYYGASLPAFAHLAQTRGYSLAGVNSVGSNAFFVRDDLLSDRVPAVQLAERRVSSVFRESRDEDGRLSFVASQGRRAVIAHMPLVDVVTGETLCVRDLPAES